MQASGWLYEIARKPRCKVRRKPPSGTPRATSRHLIANTTKLSQAFGPSKSSGTRAETVKDDLCYDPISRSRKHVFRFPLLNAA
jgi:hypothetical protein